MDGASRLISLAEETARQAQDTIKEGEKERSIYQTSLISDDLSFLEPFYGHTTTGKWKVDSRSPEL